MGKAGQSRVHVQLPVGGITFVAKKLRPLGYDKETIELITDAWRPSMKRVYTTYLKKWALFCIRFRVKLLEPSPPQVCNFSKHLAKAGLGYGALNADRSALATILPSYEGYPLGKHPLVVMGAYERNPPAPKYNVFLDVTLGISVNLIMKQAGWRNADSFVRFYNKDIEQDTDLVARTLLKNAM